MSRSGVPLNPCAIHLEVTTSSLRVRLADGREVAVPLDWFPRLRDADPEDLKEWRIIGKGVGIHFPQIDEDISVERLLAAR